MTTSIVQFVIQESRAWAPWSDHPMDPFDSEDAARILLADVRAEWSDIPEMAFRLVRRTISKFSGRTLDKPLDA